jgi:hypothetical protein
VNYFSDRNLAVVLIRMLSAYEQIHRLVHMDEDNRFNPRTTDVELLTILGRDDPKPVLLTADLYRKPEERRALRDANLTVVFFKSGFNSQTCHTQAVKILTRWPDIVDYTTRCLVPTAFQINASATNVERLCRTCDLRDR